MIEKSSKNKLFPADPQEQKPFISAGWQQHAELVTHLCQFSQNILLIIAPQGGGKTTFLQHCRKMSTSGLRKLVLTAKENQSAEALMQDILSGFELEWQGIKMAFQQVRTCVEEAAAKQITWGLFIDDAHLLSNEQLKMLLHLMRFEAEPRKQLHLVFLGEPSLELRLFSPEFASYLQGKLYTVELETWTLPDVKAFFAEDPFGTHFSAEQVVGIFERSRGLPGYVIRERNQLLQQDTHMGHTMNKSGVKHWGKHPISLAILAGVVFGSTYLLFSGTAEEDATTVSIPLNTAQSENPAPQEAETPSAVQPGPEIAYSFEGNAAASESVEEMATEATPVSRAPVRAQKREEAVRSATRAPREPVHTVVEEDEVPIASNELMPEEVPMGNTSGYLLDVAQAEEESRRITVQDDPAHLMTPATPMANRAAEASPKAIEKAPEKVATKVKAAQRVSLADVETQPSKIEKRLTTQEEKVLSAAAGGQYTLQLLAASNEDNIKRFINQHGIQDKTRYYRSKRGGKDWFVVVYGEFGSQQEAKAALAQMPASLKGANLQPWVREVSTIKGQQTS